MANNEKEKMHYAVQHGIPRVNFHEFYKQAKASVVYNQHNGCIVAVGEAGVGKTQGVQQLARELDYNLVVINTANWSLLSGGIPSIRDEGDKFFQVKVASFFPKVGEKTILFFDELNRGTAGALATFFNLFEDRRLYDYVLPKECVVMGAMNPSTKGYSVNAIESEAAMRRRIKFFYVIPSLDDFMKHAETPAFHHECSVKVAENKSCHPDILAYIKSKPTTLYDEKARDAGQQYACPAVWNTVSVDAYISQDMGESLDGEFFRMRTAASLNEGMANDLVTFLANNSMRINADKIVKSYVKSERVVVKKFIDKKDSSELAQACADVSLILFSNKPSPAKVIPNLLAFWEDLPDDLSSGFIRGMHTDAEKNAATDYMDELIMAINSDDTFSERWANLFSRLQLGVRLRDGETKKAAAK